MALYLGENQVGGSVGTDIETLLDRGAYCGTTDSSIDPPTFTADDSDKLGGQLPAYYATAAQGVKANTALQPVTGATENNFAALTADGKIKDSGKKASDFSEWKSIEVPTPSVSGNVRTYTFDMAGKNENEIGLRILANGYANIDLRVLPAPYAGVYIVSYQDANLTSRTIVTVSASGETFTISVNSVYLSTSGAYSVISMFLWR